MKEFHIALKSFQDVQEFVALATVQPFRVLVGNDDQQVNGKSFFGMVSLDHSRPQRVRGECDGQAWQSFCNVVKKFIAN